MPLLDPEWDDRMHDPDAGFDPQIPSFLKPQVRASRFGDDHFGGDRPAIGWRLLRALCWILAPVLIGIGAALAWQSHDSTARNMVVGQLQSLGMLLSPTKSPPATAAAAPDTMQQLEPLVYNFEIVRRSVAQLAARQEQMAQDIALLQAVADDIREKVSTAPSSSSPQQTAAIPQQQAPQPRAPSAAVQSSSVPRSPPAAGPAAMLR
jgi:endonuclease/exonuclease/phosphatase (EEP) superfamily protein YafD